jgi:hypothetical protein
MLNAAGKHKRRGLFPFLNAGAVRRQRLHLGVLFWKSHTTENDRTNETTNEQNSLRGPSGLRITLISLLFRILYKSW